MQREACLGLWIRLLTAIGPLMRCGPGLIGTATGGTQLPPVHLPPPLQTDNPLSTTKLHPPSLPPPPASPYSPLHIHTHLPATTHSPEARHKHATHVFEIGSTQPHSHPAFGEWPLTCAWCHGCLAPQARANIVFPMSHHKHMSRNPDLLVNLTEDGCLHLPPPPPPPPNLWTINMLRSLWGTQKGGFQVWVWAPHPSQHVGGIGRCMDCSWEPPMSTADRIFARLR